MASGVGTNATFLVTCESTNLQHQQQTQESSSLITRELKFSWFKSI